MPEPGNPQSLNRYAYVLNHPLRYTDPSGHCSGDPNDPANSDSSCWALIHEIENQYNQVSVTNQDQWTEKELRFLLEALQDYRLWRYISSASIIFGREKGDTSYLAGVARRLGDKDGNPTGDYHIVLYDFAWYARPDARHSNVGIYLPFMRSENKFKGTIAHELTHVVQWVTETEEGYSGLVNLFVDMTGGGLPFKTNYGGRLDNKEAMAITFAIYHYWDTGDLTSSHIRYMHRITQTPRLPLVLRK